MTESVSAVLEGDKEPQRSWKSGLLAGLIVFLMFSIMVTILLFMVSPEFYFSLLCIFGCLPWSNKIAGYITGVNFEKDYLSKCIDKYLIN